VYPAIFFYLFSTRADREGSGCIISIIRLQSLLIFGTSIDPSWDYVPVTIWTVVELAVAIICSCLPALRTLIIHIYPRFASSFARSPGNSESTGNSSVNSRTRLRGRRDSTASVGMGAYLMGDVHIECGRLDIKWEGEGEVRHVEDANPNSNSGIGEGSSARRGRRSLI